MTSAEIPVAPGKLPIIGHAHLLLRDPLRFFVDAHACGPVVRVVLGTRTVYLITTPELVDRVLTTDSLKYGNALHIEAMRPLVGDGIGTSSGDLHTRQRRMLRPGFSDEQIRIYSTAMHDVAAARSRDWNSGEVIDLHDELRQMTVSVVLRALFGADADDDMITRLSPSLPFVLTMAFHRAFDPTGLWQKVPTPNNRRFDRTVTELRAFIDRVIQFRREMGIDGSDLLSTVMSQQDSAGKGLSDQQVYDNTMSLLFGGSDTTAATLMWIFYYLSLHPDAEERVHAEVDSVLGGRKATYDDVPKLPFLNQVVLEGLRLYPAVWLIPRRALVDVELASRAVQKNSILLVSPYSLHRDESLYVDANNFNPDRWLPENRKNLVRGSFVPFGDGNRRCLGESFALTETVLMLATLASQWQFRCLPKRNIRPHATIVVSPKSLPMMIERRS